MPVRQSIDTSVSSCSKNQKVTFAAVPFGQQIVFGVPYGAAHGTNTEAGVRRFGRIRVVNNERRKLKLLEDGFPFPPFFSLLGFKLVPAQAVFFDGLHGFDDIGVEGLVFDFRVLPVKVGGRHFKNAGHFWKGKELDAAEFAFLFSLDDSLVDGLAGVFDLPFGGESFGDFGWDADSSAGVADSAALIDGV